jgi:hypothetical protein
MRVLEGTSQFMYTYEKRDTNSKRPSGFLVVQRAQAEGGGLPELRFLFLDLRLEFFHPHLVKELSELEVRRS